jgi:hypothetical protein
MLVAEIAVLRTIDISRQHRFHTAMKFISVRVRAAIVMHGYAEDNTEITEELKDEPFLDKLLAIERIQSISEKYILVSSSHGRIMYWEYEGGMASIKKRLESAGLVVA